MKFDDCLKDDDGVHREGESPVPAGIEEEKTDADIDETGFLSFDNDFEKLICPVYILYGIFITVPLKEAAYLLCEMLNAVLSFIEK